jgi:manganese/zinc/iron transport system ATP- binding protein
MTSIALSVSGLSVAFPRGVNALEGVSFEIPKGTVCALVGPNGAGKSTLLRSIMGLERKSRGSCLIFGAPFKAGNSNIAYMPQTANIDWDFPATVGEVVGMGLAGDQHPIMRLTSGARRTRKEKIMQVLEQVGMEALIDRPLSQLSGGQRKRTFFARALAQKPDIFLLDEPFAGVDYQTENTLTEHLQKLSAEGYTALVVHHDVTSVERIFKHVVLLNIKVFANGPVSEVWSESVLSRTFHPYAACEA